MRMLSRSVLLVAGLLALAAAAQGQDPATKPAPQPADAPAALALDEAQVAGVAGYPIGIFGTGFGDTQGAGQVMILKAPAKITQWSDTLIKAVVPAVPPGVGTLAVTNAEGKTATGPFEVYTIDPKFLAHPAELVNLAYKKPFVITGEHNDWGGKPAEFLGYNVNRGANLMPPFAAAVDLGPALKEDVWFYFYGGSDYYVGADVPTEYTIDASADSPNGTDGTWKALATITDNTRRSRIHKVTLTGEHWIRIHVTAMGAKAKEFRFGEIRVYQRKAPGGEGIDCIGVLGDSITFSDLGPTGPSALHELIAKEKNNGTVPAVYVMGLVGAGAGGLSKNAKAGDPYSLATALSLQPDIRYLGVAFGTNDSQNPAFLPQYQKNLTDGVEQVIAAGKVPILARLPDTDNTRHGYGSPAAKKQAVRAVDEIDAKYRLIPGPDFYTPFRENPKDLISDGTHHSPKGGAVARQLWADTFLHSGIYGRPTPPASTPTSAPAK